MASAQVYENIFSIEEPIVIRTLPQYADYHGLYYNDLIKDINSGNSIPNSQIIISGSEYRVLSKEYITNKSHTLYKTISIIDYEAFYNIYE